MYDIVTRGNQLSVEQYQDAQKQQSALARELDELLAARYDIVIDLSTGGEALKGLDSVDRPDNSLIWSLCGVPSINLPLFTGPLGLPFGAQAFARRYNDYLLLAFARHLQAQGVLHANTPLPAFAR